LVKELRQLSAQRLHFPAGSSFYLAGAAAQGADLLHALAESLPWIACLALMLTFLVLLRAFKSLILPLKAIALDLISLTVAYGITVLAFGNRAISHLLGLYHLNQIEAWALLFLCVLLFGVSMDYEVFIISRIKEAKDSGLSNSEAVLSGLRETGVVVSTAALIFIGAVSGLSFGHFAGLQEIGIGLAFGTLIDASIVRALLLPSVMILLGRWNWWLPSSHSRRRKN
jgi:RND superfamily putative drug exporter